MIVESDIKSLKEEKVNLKMRLLNQIIPIYLNYIRVVCLSVAKEVVRRTHWFHY